MHLNFKTIIGALLVLFATNKSALSQDTIVLKNNITVVAKIAELNTTEVKYKRFDYQDGPLFTALKWDIKYIIYANGIKENFESINQPKPKPNDVKDLRFQPFGNFKYYYQNQVITEVNMIDIVKKMNDKKLNLLCKKTNDDKVLKNTFKYAGIGLASASFLTLIGVINFKNTNAATAAAAAAPPTRGGRGRNNTSQLAIQKLRRQNAGYLALGAIVSELFYVTFNLSEIKHAHLTCDIYNRYIVE